MFYPYFRPKQQQLKQIILVEADRGRLAQVIFNLLDNSLKFTRPTRGKRKIYIVSEKDNQVTVSIEEHGGKLWAQNNPNGGGAIFSFIIPSSQQHLGLDVSGGDYNEK